LRLGNVIVYGPIMRPVTTRFLQDLLGRRAHERSLASLSPGTVPVFGSFPLLCPACASPLVLRVGPHALRYYCACRSGLAHRTGTHAIPSRRDHQRVLPPRALGQREELTTRQ
jgi:hypothetical protein